MKNKKTLLFTTIMGLVSVFVGAFSTFAWFQIDSQPIQTEMVTGSGSVSLVNDSIYGYKINPTLGANGKINYDNTTVTKKNGSTISTTNHALEGDDSNFDIPDSGIGYYLIEKNAQNTFTYSYNSTCMATKFTSKTGGNVKSHYIASKALSATTYRIKNYSFESNSTVYEQIPISTTNNTSIVTLDTTGDNATFDVTITYPGTYKIWLTYSEATNKWDFSLETIGFSASAVNLSSTSSDYISNTELPLRANRSTSGKAINGQKFYLKCNNIDWTSDNAQIYLYLMDAASNATNKEWCGPMTISSGSGATAILETTLPTVSWEIKGIIGVRCSTAGSGWGNKWNQTQDLGFTSDNQNCITLYDWDNNGSLGTYAKVASNSTNRYYFYNYYNGNKVFSGTNIYAYCWDYYKEYGRSNSALANADFPGCQMFLTGTPNLYYVDVSISYNRIIFSNGTSTSKTSDLTLSSSKPYWKPSNSTGSSGSWSSSSSYTGSTTYYLFDPNRLLMGTSPHYCYYWDIDGCVEPVLSWSNAATMTYNSTYGYYSISISDYYDRAIFTINRGTPSNNTQTVNLTLNSNSPYYILSGTVSDSGLTKFTGDWYGSFDNSSIDTSNTTTYYIYDKAGLLSGAPYAYGYRDNVPGESSTYYVNQFNDAWPGIITANSPLPNDTVNISGLYSVNLSNDYDHIIFNNGSRTIQTDDDSAALVDNCPIFVLDGGSKVEDGITKFTGSWQETLAAITMTAVYFIYDGNTYTEIDTSNLSGLSSNLGRGATEGGGKFTPDSVPNQEGKDVVNGILYNFVPEETYWYTSSSIFDETTKFIPNSTTLNAGSHNLYKRMICDMRDMKTFYIDASNSGTGVSNTYWQNISICGSGLSDSPYFSSNDTGATWKIGTNLYRVTLPSSYTVRVANAGYTSTGGNNTSATFSVSASTGYLYVEETSSGSNCSVTWCSDLATNIGTATIYVKGPNANSFTGTTMSIGDQDSNDFIYELGLTVAAGSEIYVQVDETDSTTNYYRYDNYVATIPSYITYESTTGNKNVVTTSYTGNARFNFYLTHNEDPSNRKLSITMVPELGNGYYIMPYNSTLGTSTYSGAIKMNSGSSTSASYAGFYADAGEEIYIRSYIDAVDRLYNSSSILAAGVYLGTSDGSTTTAPGVLHFTNAGYYNIDVYNGSISVTSYSINDFFKLNALDTSSTSTSALIKAQKTSLVIEVQFTCNNTYDSVMTLSAENALSSYVGATLYCTDTQLSDPYNYLRNNYYSNISATTSAINDCNSSFVIPKSSGNTVYYAYILIDYLPGVDYSSFASNYSGNIYFILNSVQRTT